MNRRGFLSAGLQWTASLATARAFAALPVSPSPDPTAPPFPEWNLGGDSASTTTVLMFRGNPTHTFYGTGPLRQRLELQWRVQMGRFVTTLHGAPHVWAGTGWSGQPVKWGERIFVGAVDKSFYCFDARSGAVLWRHPADRMFKSSACFFRGRIYVGNVDNRLRCLDGLTGRLLWSYDSGRDLDSSPCVVNGRLYVGGEDGFVKCFDPETGALHWRSEFGEGHGSPPGSGGIESSPAVADDEVYVGHYDGYVLCLDAKQGREKWRAATGGDTDVSPVIIGDRLYCAAEETSPVLRCFDRSARGKVVWEHRNSNGFWSTPALVDGKLYIGGNDGLLYCLDAASGRVAWTFKAQAAIWCSPVVVDGKVLFGSYDPYFYSLDAKSGKLLWKYEMGERTHSTPCVVDGRVYVGSANGWFHCFG